MSRAVENFLALQSAQLAVTGVSASTTFSIPVTGDDFAYKISNKGASGAYLAWGKGSATAQVSTATPAANCDYIGVGAILIQCATNGFNTIAAIQDTAATTLEISIGYGY